MSNKCQKRCKCLAFVKRKQCSAIQQQLLHSISLAILLALLAALLPPSACAAKLQDAQIKLLINDDELLMQQPKPATALEAAQAELEHGLAAAADEHERYNLYRSELKRLSYETIHRILRDENEPIYRREDAELRYYQQRSYQPTHEVVKRAVPTNGKSANRPHYLDAKTFKNFNGDSSAITELELSSQQLEHVNLSAFAALKIVNLYNNSLNALPIVENSTIVALNLNANRIESGTAPRNLHLRELHLSSNAIESLTTLNLSLLSALETLDLSCNRIENLETAFFPQRMHNLKHLNLAHNRLGNIYRETFYNLLSLNTLLLAHNNISDIDYETFLALPNLQFLDLSYNRLRGESIRALQGIPDLVRLSIAYNPEVGASMQEFVASWSLKELDASGTGLCQIPAALAQSVRTLKLTDNWLKVINCGDLDSYPLLQYLDLSNSRIEDIEDDALGRLEILEVLFLDHNKLRKVPVSLPTSLEHLFLQHNDIMEIQVQSFQGLNSLQTLDLSGNKLLYLPALPLPKLLTLNVQAAGLKGLSQAIVHTLPRLRDLLLEENPIKCSDLLSIAEWASPCRIAERSSGSDNSNSNNVNANTIAGDAMLDDNRVEDVGQQEESEQELLPAKIDLKQKFVRMHNFYEKFRSNCGAARQMMPAASVAQQTPPACAIELDAVTAALGAAEFEDVVPQQQQQQHVPATEVATLNVPSELQHSGNAAAANTQTSNVNAAVRKAQREGGKLFEFNQKNFTAEMAKSLRTKVANDDKAATTTATATATTRAMPEGEQQRQTPPIRPMNSAKITTMNKLPARTRTFVMEHSSSSSSSNNNNNNNNYVTAKTLRATAVAVTVAASTTATSNAANAHLLRQQITALSTTSTVAAAAAKPTAAVKYFTAAATAATTDTEQQQRRNQDEPATTAWSQRLAAYQQPATATKTTTATTTAVADSAARTTATTTKANQVEANTATAALAINSDSMRLQQKQTTATTTPQLATTSSLSNGKSIAQQENVDAATATTAKTVVTGSNNSMLPTIATKNETAIHMPQIISTVMEMGNNYNVKATTAAATTATTTQTPNSLLSQKGYKTASATAAMVASTAAVAIDADVATTITPTTTTVANGIPETTITTTSTETTDMIATAIAELAIVKSKTTATTTNITTGESATSIQTATAATAATMATAGQSQTVMSLGMRVDKDLTRNDNADNNKVVENKLVQQQQQQSQAQRQQPWQQHALEHNFKRANPNFNDIAERWPTEETILAEQQHQSETLPTLPTTKTMATHSTIMTPVHKHEPLQLHIKDRHLIGTPLLMHKGQNILVEAAEQLMLPAMGKAATSTVRPTTTQLSEKMTVAAKGSISEAQLAKSQLQQQQHAEYNNPFTKWPQQQIMATTRTTDKQAQATAINDDEAATDNREVESVAEDKQMPTTKAHETQQKQSVAHLHKQHAGNKDPHNQHKPTLIMKKMTITKQTHAAKQQQQQQQQHAHYMLNTPRENEAVNGGRTVAMARQHYKEHIVTAANDVPETTVKIPLDQHQQQQQQQQQQHKHSTVNTAIVRKQEPPQHAGKVAEKVEQLRADELIKHAPDTMLTHEPEQAPAPERVTKSEQWLDIRRASTTGHPGAVILLSFSLLVVLLIGLMHVYRCDMPWRRHLSHHQQRPHQRHFNEDDAHSFLNYHNNISANASNNSNSNTTNTSTNPSNGNSAHIQRWHHSVRTQPPYSSPLHNLHVRELQKTSAVECAKPPAQLGRAYYSAGAAYTTVPNAATAHGGSSDGSRTSSSLSSSHSSAILDAEDAFYIEMSPDAAQLANDALHADMLPMELLSVSTACRRHDSEALAAEEHVPTKAATTTIDSNSATATPLSNMKLASAAATTRKFDLW